MQTTETAGGIVLNAIDEVIIVSQRGDSWSLPKGHIDPDETPRQAAEREILEETGISQLTFMKELGMYERHRIGKGGQGEDTNELKRIHMFFFRTLQQTLEPTDPYNPEARWVSIEEALELLTHPKDKEFLLSVQHSLI